MNTQMNTGTVNHVPRAQDRVTHNDVRNSAPWYQRMLSYFELSSVLRVFGAGVMVTAIALFLFQQWESGNDLFRYGLLLGQTLILSGLGFATSHWLREPKSARVFLALGLVSSAACFTILSALLYSVVRWDALSAVYPGFAFWQIDTVATALLWMAGSMVLLWPVSQIGFTVLARPAAGKLTGLFLANGALLMLPVRDPMTITAIAVVAAVGSLILLGRVARNLPALRTGEGRIARLIAMLPIAILAGRSAYLYASDAFSFVLLGTVGYVTLRQMAINTVQNARLKSGLEVASLLPALVTALACADLVTSLLGYAREIEVAVATIVVVLVASLMDLARRSERDGKIYAALAGALALVGSGLELVLAPSMATAAICIVVSALVAVYARYAGLTTLYRLALVALLLSVAHQIQYAVQSFDLTGWMGLAVLGIAAIVLAAAVERHGDRLKMLLQVRAEPSATK